MIGSIVVVNKRIVCGGCGKEKHCVGVLKVNDKMYCGKCGNHMIGCGEIVLEGNKG